MNAPGSGSVHGLELAEGFYRDAVHPILQKSYPHLRHSAALIGSGSEVLGFDTEMSSDHHWGPRCQLFLSRPDHEALSGQLWRDLSLDLPTSYQGFPTNYSEADAMDKGTQLLEPKETGPVNHRVDILVLEDFLKRYLGIDVTQEIAASTWLVLSSQKLRSIVDGRVFHDDLGLHLVRNRLGWYPRDVWLYVLASCWKRIGQEEHLMGRTGLAGDEVGSSLIGSRIVRDMMRLALYMEKKYPPYAKWLGTAFRELQSSEALTPLLANAVHSTSWQQREENLSRGLERLVEIHNTLGITGELPTCTSPFWGRPFKVIWGERIAAAIAERIEDSHIRRLATARSIGSIDLFSDNTDMVGDTSLVPLLKRLFDQESVGQ